MQVHGHLLWLCVDFAPPYFRHVLPNHDDEVDFNAGPCVPHRKEASASGATAGVVELQQAP